MVARKKQKLLNLRVIIRRFFKAHGIKSPSNYLANRAGISRTQMYAIYQSADKGIGTRCGQMDPRAACFLILQSEEIMEADEVFAANPVTDFLQPKLRKFYQEQNRNGKNTSGKSTAGKGSGRRKGRGPRKTTEAE